MPGIYKGICLSSRTKLAFEEFLLQEEDLKQIYKYVYLWSQLLL